MPMTLKDGRDILLADPQAFLETCGCRIAGGGPSSISGLAVFQISMPAAEQNHWQNANGFVPFFNISYTVKRAPEDRYFDAGEECRDFEAYYVAMKKMVVGGSVPAGTLLRLPGTGGCTLCLTSQLSGCTFGVGNQVAGGCCTVSHIQPSGALLGAQPVMANQSTDLHGMHGQTVGALVEKGPALTYQEKANVMGHRLHGRWTFFVQPYDNMTHLFDPIVQIG